MNIFQSILLGIVQGLTEFLPVSSSGHLVIVPRLLGWQIPPDQAFVFDVLVQVATLVAVITFFWRDLVDIIRAWLLGLVSRRPFESQGARLGWNLILATIPAGLLGLALKDRIEAAFNSLVATGVFLLVTAVLLLTAEIAGRRNRCFEQMTWKDALMMGLFQAIAIFPGVSRSGSTMTGGMIRSLDRQSAARFSFLMSIPIMLAAGLLATLDMLNIPNLGSLLPVFIPGFITAAVVGYVSIRWLLRYITHHPLYVFAIYCAVVGFAVLGFSLAGA